MRYFTGSILLFSMLFFSCSGNKTAQIWTDSPEFAIYGEYFNTVQNKYKVSIKYYEFPLEELKKNVNTPDIVVGSWLKNSSTGTYFRTLDNYFGSKKLSRNIFYPKLLASGRIDKNQYLIPISFNIPA